MYEVALNNRATRDFERNVTHNLQAAILTRIESLGNNPRPVGYRPIRGRPGLYRVRQGAYRILYKIDDANEKVVIFRVLHRREAYR